MGGGGGIHGTVFGLNLYLYPPPPVSSFGHCDHHISVLFPQLSIQSCVVVEIASGSALVHRVQPFRSSEKCPPPPIVQNMYKTIFSKITNIHVFSTTYFGKIHQLFYIKPCKSIPRDP